PEMLQRRLQAESIFFVGIFLALLAAGRDAMLHDPGTFWHVKAGRSIAETHAFPRVDAWTFTRGGAPWIAQQWLGEAIMAMLDRAGGLDALLLAAAALLALTYSRVFTRLTAAGLLWPLAALIMGLVVAGSSCHFLVRPHLVTIALSGWLYGRLCDIDAGT